MAMTASAHRIGESLKHEVGVNGRHVMFTDEPVGVGGSDEAPAPHELLPATLAACISGSPFHEPYTVGHDDCV